MEQTIIMTKGASKVTSTHKKLIKGAKRFFQSTAKKLSWQYKNSCKCKRKGIHLSKKMEQKGCVFVQRVYYSTTILKIFDARALISAKFARKTAYFSSKLLQEKRCLFPKNCNRKGTVPRWHTRVEKLGKCPPGPYYRLESRNIWQKIWHNGQCVNFVW